MTACQTLPKMGMTDHDILANLPADVAPNDVTLTPDQAGKVRASTEANVCGLPTTSALMRGGPHRDRGSALIQRHSTAKAPSSR